MYHNRSFNTTTTKNLRNNQSTSLTTQQKATNLIQHKSNNQQPIKRPDHFTITTTMHKPTKSIHPKTWLQTTTQFHCLNTQEPNTSHHQPARGNQHLPNIHLYQLSKMSLMRQTMIRTLKLKSQKHQTHQNLSKRFIRTPWGTECEPTRHQRRTRISLYLNLAKKTALAWQLLNKSN